MAGCTKESGTCAKCVDACSRKPGWFKPGEVEHVADYLGVSLAELFRTKLAVDWWEDDDPTFVLAPAVVGSASGEEYPGDPSGVCVFLAEGRCIIHPVKPFECREFWCGSTTPAKSLHSSVHGSWAGHQEQIVGLLGREPVASSYSILDLLFRGSL